MCRSCRMLKDRQGHWHSFFNVVAKRACTAPQALCLIIALGALAFGCDLGSPALHVETGPETGNLDSGNLDSGNKVGYQRCGSVEVSAAKHESGYNYIAPFVIGLELSEAEK